MTHIVWSEDLATGIRVIDGQHKRIIHYINQLSDAQNLDDRELVGEVLINLVDYTLSHFAFEESLMDEAGYEASSIHKKTHEAFRNKISNYKERFEEGEDVTEELYKLLNVWLMDHIADDDSSYVPFVVQNIPGINTEEQAGWLRKKITQYFG
jgi:hemerythrin